MMKATNSSRPLTHSPEGGQPPPPTPLKKGYFHKQKSCKQFYIVERTYCTTQKCGQT